MAPTCLFISWLKAATGISYHIGAGRDFILTSFLVNCTVTQSLAIFRTESYRPTAFSRNSQGTHVKSYLYAATLGSHPCGHQQSNTLSSVPVAPSPWVYLGNLDLFLYGLSFLLDHDGLAGITRGQLESQTWVYGSVRQPGQR